MGGSRRRAWAQRVKACAALRKAESKETAGSASGGATLVSCVDSRGLRAYPATPRAAGAARGANGGHRRARRHGGGVRSHSPITLFVSTSFPRAHTHTQQQQHEPQDASGTGPPPGRADNFSYRRAAAASGRGRRTARSPRQLKRRQLALRQQPQGLAVPWLHAQVCFGRGHRAHCPDHVVH